MDNAQFAPHTTWKFQKSTREAVSALVEACRQAKESIYIEIFLMTPDSFSQEFLEILMKRASEGLSVKLILDSAGSWSFGQSQYVEEMTKAGVKIKFFNWMLPFSKNSKKLWYFRNHRRLFIFDRTIMFTGGTCIGKRMENWRETQIRLEGPVVSQAIRVFDNTWKRVYKKHTLLLGTQYKTGMDGFSYITHAPIPTERYLYHRLIEAVRLARKSVYLTTPYFLPDHRLQRVLLLAKKRGADVRILMPRNSDHPIVDKGAHLYFNKLLSKGVRIFLYDSMVHAKTAVIDGEWGMVGTLNLDNISLRYNFESAVITTNTSCAGELKEDFMNDLRASREMTLEEWNRRSWISKILDLAVWPIRKLL